MSQIRTLLYEKQIPSPAGKEHWETSAVMHILRNEKYVGDIMLQKKYTVDHISHREVKNDCTKVPAYYIRNHHDPIVTRETYDRVQTIRRLRGQGGKSGEKGRPIQYPFGEKLICPHCGPALTQRKLKIQDNSSGWCCDNCCKFILKSKRIEQAVLRAYQVVDVPASGESAAVFAKIKRLHPRMERVDYYWIDDLVDYITFGKHEKPPQIPVREDLESPGIDQPLDILTTTEENKNDLESLGINHHSDIWATTEATRIDLESPGIDQTSGIWEKTGYRAVYNDVYSVWGDYTVIVVWKCGIVTTVFSGVEKKKDVPSQIAELYQNYLKNQPPRMD
jgi:hypothetical protein